MRGRIITGSGKYSEDFAITEGGILHLTNYFNLCSAQYWYGDYNSAGGYVEEVSLGRATPRLPPSVEKVFNYFPMWVEPDGTVRYVRVKAEIPRTGNSSHHLNIAAVAEWLAPAASVNLYPEMDAG